VPFIVYFPAVLLCAWLGGLGPGLLSATLGGVISWYFFFPPPYSLAISSPLALAQVNIYLLAGALISLMTENLHRARRRSEESEAREREQREKLRVTLASIGDAVIATDAEGRVTFMNHIAESLTGWRHEDASMRPLADVFNIINEQTRQTVENPAPRVMCEGQIVSLASHTALITKDGTERPIDYSEAPIKDAKGKTVGAVLVFHDITKRKQEEDERSRLLASERAARREAEEASRLKDEFLSTLSHELRTPLISINGWTQLLREGKISGERAERALESIECNAKSQTQLVNDLLDVSRIITGKTRLDFGPLRLGSVIEAAVESVRPSAEAKEIQLSALLDPAADPVSGDAERLQQVVWNLLSNAIKFTQKGGRVQVRLERVDSHVEIIVADDGQGINPEFLPHVFDRFSQEEGGSDRQHGGLGLGLAIVRHLVELHGGTVHADSAGLGQGATFTITLPVIPVRMAAPDGKREAEHGRATPSKNLPSIRGGRVLLVDDNADGRELVEEMLDQGGAETRTASSAAEALAILDGWRPDALISDIGMPGEDGYALIEKLRSRERERGERLLPAIALTAYVRAEDRLRTLSAGYQAHVSKPVDMAELLTVIASLLISQNIRRDGNDE
jgi:PAS domain S-box-containing protein